MRATLLLLVLVAFGVLADDDKKSETHNKPPEGFTALFNGKDLTGWQGHVDMRERVKLGKYKAAPEKAAKGDPAKPSEKSLKEDSAQPAKEPEAYEKRVKEQTAKLAGHWTVEDGVLVYDGKAKTSLQTAKDYGNFELFVDWKIEAKGDSGLYLRGQPQVQIWDSDEAAGAKGEDKGSGSGGLWNNPKGHPGKMPLKKADKPVGEWNTFHIVMKGDKVTVRLNGVLVVDNQSLVNFWEKGQPLPKRGPIELQDHGDRLRFRNIYIKELPDE